MNQWRVIEEAIEELFRNSDYYKERYSVMHAYPSWDGSVDQRGNGVYDVTLSPVWSSGNLGRYMFIFANNRNSFHKIIVMQIVHLIIHNNPIVDLKNDSCFQLIKKIFLNCVSSNDLNFLYWKAYNKVIEKIENSSLINQSDSLIDAMEQADSVENFIGYFMMLLEKTKMLSEFFNTFVNLIDNKHEKFLNAAINHFNICDYPDWIFKHYTSSYCFNIRNFGYLVQLV